MSFSVSTLEQAYGAKEITSTAMRSAIADWFSLYEQTEATSEEDPCQRIPYVVVNKLTKATLAEYTPSCDKQFGSDILAALSRVQQEAVQMALIGGEALIKPIPTKTGFRFAVIPRDAVCVFERDATGKMIDIGTSETSAKGNSYYTLLERRSVDADGRLTITNALYRSYDSSSLGTRCSLNELEAYADLVDQYTYSQPIGSIGLISVRTPMANSVDRSRDAVSCFAACTDLIHRINQNEAQLNGEFKRGESRILASADYFFKKRGSHTGETTKSFDDHLFVKLEGDPDRTGITIFSPTLREQSFLARKESYLRGCETILGLKRGILSTVEAQERTAKEITSSEGDYNLTILDFQAMWEKAVRETVVLCSILGRIYRVPGAVDLKPEDIQIDWGNGVLYDEDKTWADYLAMVAAGLIKPEIALGWRFNMPIETPADLQAIREKYMPDLDALMGGTV